jgi:hypothetical protein
MVPNFYRAAQSAPPGYTAGPIFVRPPLLASEMTAFYIGQHEIDDEAIADAAAAFHPSECANYFRAAGYGST